ncbi:MAG: hypothetical protein E2P02_11875 [Acidobacteria bacterium]|nr:MAG: hypothetical protein E2P02_11875 [Acidobacteriota bacterium]
MKALRKLWSARRNGKELLAWAWYRSVEIMTATSSPLLVKVILSHVGRRAPKTAGSPEHWSIFGEKDLAHTALGELSDDLVVVQLRSDQRRRHRPRIPELATCANRRSATDWERL